MTDVIVCLPPCDPDRWYPVHPSTRPLCPQLRPVHSAHTVHPVHNVIQSTPSTHPLRPTRYRVHPVSLSTPSSGPPFHPYTSLPLHSVPIWNRSGQKSISFELIGLVDSYCCSRSHSKELNIPHNIKPVLAMVGNRHAWMRRKTIFRLFCTVTNKSNVKHDILAGYLLWRRNGSGKAVVL